MALDSFAIRYSLWPQDRTMTNYSAKTVAEYISAAPEMARPHLKAIRAAIQATVPKAEEIISWGKPYYRYHDR